MEKGASERAALKYTSPTRKTRTSYNTRAVCLCEVLCICPIAYRSPLALHPEPRKLLRSLLPSASKPASRYSCTWSQNITVCTGNAAKDRKVWNLPLKILRLCLFLRKCTVWEIVWHSRTKTPHCFTLSRVWRLYNTSTASSVGPPQLVTTSATHRQLVLSLR